MKTMCLPVTIETSGKKPDYQKTAGMLWIACKAFYEEKAKEDEKKKAV